MQEILDNRVRGRCCVDLGNETGSDFLVWPQGLADWLYWGLVLGVRGGGRGSSIASSERGRAGAILVRLDVGVVWYWGRFQGILDFEESGLVENVGSDLDVAFADRAKDVR